METEIWKNIIAVLAIGNLLYAALTAMMMWKLSQTFLLKNDAMDYRKQQAELNTELKERMKSIEENTLQLLQDVAQLRGQQSAKH